MHEARDVTVAEYGLAADVLVVFVLVPNTLEPGGFIKDYTNCNAL